MEKRTSLAEVGRKALPRTIYVRSVAGELSVPPGEGHTIYFGRNRPDVHVCVGEDDPRVSRRHGQLEFTNGQWWVTATGQLPIRFPKSQWLLPGDTAIPLTAGYTPLFIQGSQGREHLLEVYVAEETKPVVRPQDPTQPPRSWTLTPDERLVLTVVGQRYLLNDLHPLPLSWRQAADQLAELAPEDGWSSKRVEHLVAGIRGRLSRDGQAGLTREEVGEPVGNTLNDNLFTALMLSTTLTSADLRLLD
ncbi:FHA domain-containing protein [Kribbella sp. NPDC058245]|uniref:FHA domain-containing protein n=1 Tax=Kribbella sp. NPDC058245 TaxID=3346399 RepID=UPI0036E0F013